MSTDTTVLDAALVQADVDFSTEFCFGDPGCEAAVGAANSQARADAGFALPIQSVAFGPDSLSVLFDAVAFDQVVTEPVSGQSAGLFRATIDLVLTTQPIPEPSTALLLGIGLLGLAGRRK